MSSPRNSDKSVSASTEKLLSTTILPFIEFLPFPLIMLNSSLEIKLVNKELKNSLNWRDDFSFNQFWESNFSSPFIFSLLKHEKSPVVSTHDDLLYALYPVFIPEGKETTETIVIIFVQQRSQHLMDEKFIQSEKLAAINQTAVMYNDRINSPLQVILGTCALMQFHLDEPAKIREFISTIEKEVNRISSILRKMRNLSRLSIKNYAIHGVSMIDLENSTD